METAKKELTPQHGQPEVELIELLDCFLFDNLVQDIQISPFLLEFLRAFSDRTQVFHANAWDVRSILGSHEDVSQA